MTKVGVMSRRTENTEEKATMTQDAAAQDWIVVPARHGSFELHQEGEMIASGIQNVTAASRLATYHNESLEAARAEGQRQGRAEAFKEAASEVRSMRSGWLTKKQFVSPATLAFVLKNLAVKFEAQAIQESK